MNSYPNVHSYGFSYKSRVVDIAKVLAHTLLLSNVAAAAKDFTGRVSHSGTVGLGLDQWDPVCAYACRNSAAGFKLDCPEDHHGMAHGGMMHHMTSPQCYATNDYFMQTLAWCIHTHCPEDTPISKLETYWELNVAGRKDNQPLPKYSYQDALARVTEPPTSIANSTQTLNRTSLVNEWFYAANYGALSAIEANISVDNIYTLVLVITCTVGPVLFSLFRFLPLPQRHVSKFYAYFIDPPAFGTKHAISLFGLGIVPTRGQALFIAYIWAINIILSGPGYVIKSPNLWYEGSQAIAMSVANRVGMLSFGNLILAILYSSRNNLLLYITNWSRSTFVLIHRWLAFLTIIQACLHSVLYLYYQVKAGTHSEEAAYPYWYWGIIATLAFALILPFSLLPIREKFYEFFLASHIVLALLGIIATFLHVYFRYFWQWGYEIWVAVAFAFWGFDRFLARPIKLLKNGTKRAYISVVDDDYLKIEIPGISASGDVYLYFPTLTWRIWENHPFSVVPLIGSSAASEPTTPTKDIEADKEAAVATQTLQSTSSNIQGTHGIVFFVRRRGGFTRSLARHAGSANGTLVLVESSYGADMSILYSPRPQPSYQYPNVLIIAGGVGITAVLPQLGRPFLARPGTTKLYWGVRKESLVKAVEGILVDSDISANSDTGVKWGGADVNISVGERFDLRRVLENELQNNDVIGGTTVVVSGPPGMADEVRNTVTEIAKRGAVVRFTQDQYGW